MTTHPCFLLPPPVLSVAALVRSFIKKPLNTAAATMPACAPSAPCVSPSWTPRQVLPRATATSGWRRTTVDQVCVSVRLLFGAAVLQHHFCSPYCPAASCNQSPLFLCLCLSVSYPFAPKLILDLLSPQDASSWRFPPQQQCSLAGNQTFP